MALERFHSLIVCSVMSVYVWGTKDKTPVALERFHSLIVCLVMSVYVWGTKDKTV